MKLKIKTNKLKALITHSLIALIFYSCNSPAKSENPIIGSWKPERYILSGGESSTVDGHIFFSEDQWSVVFFVLDNSGNPVNGSAEGGNYILEDEMLTFRHYYNLSDIQQGATTSLQKVLRNGKGQEIPEEVCKIEFDDGFLIIYFPSGNAMMFSKLD